MHDLRLRMVRLSMKALPLQLYQSRLGKRQKHHYKPCIYISCLCTCSLALHFTIYREFFPIYISILYKSKCKVRYLLLPTKIG